VTEPPTITVSELAQHLAQQRSHLMSRTQPAMPLVLVLQFWKGDVEQAMDLARLLADIEPGPCSDVVLVFARQSNCPVTDIVRSTVKHCEQKFEVWHMQVPVSDSKGYPGDVFDAWAGAMATLSHAYCAGLKPYANAFMFEPDGVPLCTDWINRIRQAMQDALDAGKYVVGPRMRQLGRDRDHINGTAVWHLPFFVNSPFLHYCPPDVAYDVFHGRIVINNSHPSNVIHNAHGLGTLTEAAFHHFKRESCWLTSIKNDSARRLAREMLVR
jgi:hypothetical protein